MVVCIWIRPLTGIILNPDIQPKRHLPTQMKLVLLLQKILIASICLLYSNQVPGQSLTERWQRTWGGNHAEVTSVMLPLNNNQFLFAGGSYSDPGCFKTSPNYGEHDFAVFVLDDDGNKLWEKTYGGDRSDMIRSGLQLPDGGFIFAGESQSPISGTKTAPHYGVTDIWIVRTDANGNELWQKSYGRQDLEGARKIVATADGGFLIASYSLSINTGYNYGKSDYQLTKIDAQGNEQWTKLYGGTEQDDLTDLVRSGDGNYFISGTSVSPPSGNKTSARVGAEDIWLIKVDPNGNIIWDKTYGTTEGDFNGSLLALQDGNTLMVDHTLQTSRVRKIDTNGIQIWLQHCSGGGFVHTTEALQYASEDVNTGNLYVVGHSSRNNEGCKTSPWVGGGWMWDIWVGVFDRNGTKIDDLDFGGSDADTPEGILAYNNEVWIFSNSASPISGNKTSPQCGQSSDSWIIRLANSFYVNSNTPTSVCATEQNIKVHVKASSAFNAPNVFTVQLSDINGSFANPQNIGSKPATGTDSIPVSLPPGIPEGSGYKIRVVASAPADTTAAYPFWIYGPPQLNLGADTALCTGSSLLIVTGQQPPATQFLWQNNSTDNFYSANDAGLYWCEIRNACGEKRDTIIIAPKYLPQADIGNDVLFCSNESFNLQNSSQLPEYSYLWSTGATNAAISVSTSGTYWLKVSNSCGSKADTMQATVQSLPILNLNTDSLICRGTPLILSVNAGHASYEWSTGNNTPVINVSAPGLYWVKVTGHNSCVQIDTTIIKGIADPPGGFLPMSDSICSRNGKLLLSPLNNFSSYQWSNGMNTSSIQITNPGTYWLTVKDYNGCKGTDTIAIYPKDCIQGVFIPTAFTPNNDGLNDMFKVLVFGELLSFRLQVYNREGQLVFETSDPNRGWNGSYKSIEYSSATFVWQCSYQLANQEAAYKKGTVTLIR